MSANGHITRRYTVTLHVQVDELALVDEGGPDVASDKSGVAQEIQDRIVGAARGATGEVISSVRGWDCQRELVPTLG